MAAITRWVQYDINAAGTINDGNGAGCVGSPGYSLGTSNIGDEFTITDTNNKLYISIDGDSGPYITLTSGVELDPRFVANDITNKLRELGKNNSAWDNAICKFINTGDYGNRFIIYSGTFGQTSSVLVDVSHTDSVHDILGFTTRDEVGGTNNSNNFSGVLNVSGEYKGFLPEIYTIVITSDNDAVRGIGIPVKNIAYDGVMTTGGVYTGDTDTTYTITIDVTNGTTMAGGSGNVPIMSWTSSNTSDDSTVGTELLYPDTWYNVGDNGLMVKFTDAVFSNGNWTIDCFKPDYSSGSNLTDPPGSAYFSFSSDRGDMGGAVLTPSSGIATALGSRGLMIEFVPTSDTDYLQAGDTFTVFCHGPKPYAYDIDSINFGNTTVSTESSVKCVSFEVMSGAYILSSVKFGLYSHGSFQHHYSGNNDTMFRFGTVGPGNVAGTSPVNGIEWNSGIQPSDIDSDISPDFLFYTRANLPVVSTADDSENVGNVGIISDPVWFNIRVGTSETGASAIIYRLYFDYS